MTMNLDENDSDENSPVSRKAKLSRKEKKALKAEKKKAEAEEKERAKAEKKAAVEASKAGGVTEATPGPVTPEEVAAHLEPAPIPSIPPPEYTLWEKISPPARRKRQMANMEDGFREVLGLVRSMRENQEALLDSFQKLPEAVDSVKKLADHSARQSELLEAMNAQGEDSPLSGKFNDTLASMDQTTQQLLERSQRSEERLYTMLRRAQRRIAFMTLMVLLLFLGAMAGALYYVFPEQTRSWLDGDGFTAPVEEQETPPPTPAPEEPPAVIQEEDVQPVTPEPDADQAEDIMEEMSAPVAATATPIVEPTALPDPIPDAAPVETEIQEPEILDEDTPAADAPAEVLPAEEVQVEVEEEPVDAPVEEAEPVPAP